MFQTSLRIARVQKIGTRESLCFWKSDTWTRIGGKNQETNCLCQLAGAIWKTVSSSLEWYVRLWRITVGYLPEWPTVGIHMLLDIFSRGPSYSENDCTAEKVLNVRYKPDLCTQPFKHANVLMGADEKQILSVRILFGLLLQAVVGLIVQAP